MPRAGFGEADAAGFYISGVGIGTPISSGSPASASYGTTIGPTSFSFPITTTDGDTYLIAGSVLVGYGSAGSLFMVNLTTTYTGSTLSAGTDSFSVDVYDNIYNPGPGSWAGTYTNRSGVTLAANLGAGSSFNDNLYWDSTPVGEVGPFTTGGYHFQSVSNSLDFGMANDAATTLNGDYRFNFTIASGTATGASTSFATVPTPEPAEALPMLGLMLSGLGWARRRRSVVSKESK